MKKEFIAYEQALELKELGFEATPLGGFKQDAVFYYEKGELYYDYRPMYSSTAHEGQILAPLYQQAFRWFREKYGLVGWVEGNEGKKIFMYRIESPIDSDDQLNCYPFRTYEEAELACLKNLIEIVKKKNNL
jgi:hypothetical protein